MNGIQGDALIAELRNALNRASIRASMVASNLANLDTPGYKAMDVSFHDALKQAGAEPVRTDPRHLAPPEARLGGTPVPAPSSRITNDGNTVDVDKQMALLSRMQGKYAASAELVRKRFGLLQYAVSNGRS